MIDRISGVHQLHYLRRHSGMTCLDKAKKSLRKGRGKLSVPTHKTDVTSQPHIENVR